ncbi:MAG: CRTAC1 family protein [Gammaproteobacteria bacterium]|nr:CRTAC1 family protein [Gammaproteobacteria bacterium]
MRYLASTLVVALVTSCTWLEDSAKSIRFVDESEERGLTFTYLSGGTEKHRLPEIMGGGVAFFDSDRDGDLDVYIVQSGSLDEQPTEHGNALFVNDGSAQFVLTPAGDASANLGFGMGVAVGDIDNDALPDLFITQLGANVLLRNAGDNRFVNVTKDAGFRLEDWSTATAFADFDLDGDLDLWVVNYIDWSESMEPECYQNMLGSRDYCSPSHYKAPAQDRVFRNDGSGRFEDVTPQAGVMGTRGNGLGIVISDFNDDNLIDVYVANDSSPNHLWLNQGNFRFKNKAAIWNSAVDQHGVARAGMGIVATDLDDDADQDLVIVHIETEPNYVFSNEGDYFRDITASVGLNIHSQRYTRFGLAVDDLDNDGWLDIFEANGRVTRDSSPIDGDKFATPNAFYKGTPDGRFELLEYTEAVFTSRGTAIGDLDDDGKLDMVVVDRDQPIRLLMNQSPGNSGWLLLDIRDALDRPALGATVSVDVNERTQTRVVQSASSYLSARDPRIHFGLGSDDKVTNVRVRWISGEERQLAELQANQIVTIKEGAG